MIKQDPEKNSDSINSLNETDASKEFSPKINIDAQYIKDLSFENPIGPSFQTNLDQEPEINIDINTGGRPLKDGSFELTLQFRVEATLDTSTVFLLELTYGAVIRITGVPEETKNTVLLIEGSRLIFPFARNIIADTTRDGGFPPLFLQPIDFMELYQNQHLQ